MKIHEIEVKNFKGFEHEIFRFNPHFTVIIGENATGKTSILDALVILAGAYLLGIREAPKYHIKEYQIRRVDFGDRFAPQTPTEVWAVGEIDDRKDLKWGRKLLSHDNRNMKEATELVTIGKAHEAKTNSPENTRVSLPVLVYYSSKRRDDKRQRLEDRGKGSILKDGYYACLDLTANSKAYFEWFRNHEIKVAQQKTDDILLNLLRDAIEVCMPNWKEVYFDFDENDIVGTRTRKNGEKQRVRFDNLSDGQQMIVRLVAELAYRCITLNGHLGADALRESRGVVLIDELDMHLHPSWQRHIVADLKRVFPNIQFIATTHSPFIVQSLNASELINLNRVCDISPSQFAINEVAEYFMGVENIFGLESQTKENLSHDYLKLLEDAHISNFKEIEAKLVTIENKITDPAVRAFLQMQKLKKQSQD